jgi:uncharacterized protein (DUF2237 family)
MHINKITERNILGQELRSCCKNPLTGFLRDGFCKTDSADYGVHVVCAIITKEFLEFTKERGNDLSTSNYLYGFPGLKEGDQWCLCAARWVEAWKAGVAPLINVEATNEKALEMIDKEILLQHRKN